MQPLGLGFRLLGGAMPDRSASDAGRAARLVWTAFGFFLAAVVIGFGWDRRWHATHPFEDFFSPPHLFIYAMFALTGLTIARIALAAGVRDGIGRGAVFLAVSGIAAVGAAGLFDGAWHTAFGLDETGWSFPHALLGWGVMLTFFGLLSCRLALRRERPLSGVARVLLGVLAFLFPLGTLQGPLGNNLTAAHLRAVAALPVLAAEGPAQHTFRIYLRWNLTHSNPLFVPLSAFAAGLGLALLMAVIGNRGMVAAIVAGWTLVALAGQHGTAKYLGIASDPRNWLPLPVLPALLALLAARRLQTGQRAGWAVAGAVYGLFVVWFWGASPHLPLVALTAPAALGGALAGRWLFGVIESPMPRASARLVAITFAVPAMLGVVDLLLRAHTA